MYDYKYNSDGLRSKKIMASMGVETRYLYDGGRLVAQITGTQANFNNFFSNSTNCEVIWFLYDLTGIIGFTRKTSGSANETTYFYRKNVQGDITGIYQHMLGVLLAEYRYDAWGNLLGVFNPDGTVNTNTSFIGNVNPIRYRGYYYDRESNLYYLNSRYYDPGTMRFICADGQVNGGSLGANMYAYCENDPVNYYDPDGCAPGDLFNTVDAAARDFAMIYNAMSINEDLEFGARVFSKRVNGATKYYYETPFRGTSDSIIPLAIYVFGTVASLHTHAAYDPAYGGGNNSFSDQDKKWLHGTYVYVATTNGSLYKYYKKTGKTIALYGRFPSDPNDPTRRGTVSPIGISGRTKHLLVPSWIKETLVPLKKW